MHPSYDIPRESHDIIKSAHITIFAARMLYLHSAKDIPRIKDLRDILCSFYTSILKGGIYIKYE